jgi:hypothetical protein
MFFDENHLPNLMSRKFPKAELSKDYLEGVDFVDEDHGFEEAMTYYPETIDLCRDRNQRLIDKLCQSYVDSHDPKKGAADKKVLHLIVTHGYHVECMGVLHGGEVTFPHYCSKAGIALHR